MSLISESRWLPDETMSSRYSSCFAFTSPNIRSRNTCEKPMIAFSGVRSSCDMLARNSDLCLLAASSSRLFSSSSRERGLELPGALLDLLLEARVGLLELRRHAIELLGERAQLVAARSLDPLVERTRADSRCRSLDGLDRPDEPAGEEDAGGDRQEEEHEQEQRGAPDGRLERRERLAQRFLDEDEPAQRLHRLKGAEHLRPIRIASGRHRVGGGIRGPAERRSDLRQRGEAHAPDDVVDVGVADKLAARTDDVCVPAVPTRARSITGRRKLRSISATTTPRPGASSATEMVMCGCESFWK